MTNHPNRARAPVDLAGAVQSAMHPGETRAAFAARIGVKKRTLDGWLDRPLSGDLARLAEWALRQST